MCKKILACSDLIQTIIEKVRLDKCLDLIFLCKIYCGSIKLLCPSSFCVYKNWVTKIGSNKSRVQNMVKKVVSKKCWVQHFCGWVQAHKNMDHPVKVSPMNSLLKKILGPKMLFKNNDHPANFHYGSPCTISLWNTL